MKAYLNLFFLFLTLSVFSPFFAYSAEDGEKIVVRKFNEEKLEKFKNDASFDYSSEPKVRDTLWSKFKYWVWKNFFSKFNKKATETIWTLVQVAIALFALAVIIYYLMKSGKIALFSKKQVTAPKINFVNEDIHQIDFDKIIDQSVAGKEFRVAVRYLYLKSLKHLSEKNLINWRSEKTNRDYNRELRSSQISHRFKEITLLFDYSWYGNFELNETTYTAIKNSFDQFNKELTTGK